MTPPVKPAGGTPIPSSGSGSQPTQGTKNDQAPPTDKSVDNPQPVPGSGVPAQEVERLRQLNAAQEQVLRDQNRKNAELTQRLRDMDARISKVETPAPSTDDMNAEFWKNPVGVMNQLIRDEMKKTVGPLNEQLSRQTQMSEYEKSKLRLKAQYSDIWDKIETSVDNFITAASAQGVEVNDQLMDVAALTSSGLYYRGQLGEKPVFPGSQPNDKREDPVPPQPVFSPPHLRPSAPAIPGAEPEKPQARELTENERRLARERGWTPEQYLAWLDVPPEGVAHSKLGREERK